MMSRCERADILEKLLGSEKFKEIQQEEGFQVKSKRFSDDSGVVLVEALKKLAFSYCDDSPDLTIIRNINKKLEEKAK